MVATTRRQWMLLTLVVAWAAGCGLLTGPVAAQNAPTPAKLLPPLGAAKSLPQTPSVQPKGVPAAPQPPAQPIPVPPPAPPANALTLSQLLDLAAVHNPELAAAHARADSARGRLIQAGLYINPKVLWEAAMMTLNHGNSGGEQGPLFTQEVVTAHKIQLSEGAAAQGVEAADWAAVTKQYDVMTRVRVAFFEVLTAQAEVEANIKVKKLANEGLAAAEKLKKGGAAVQPDVLQARVEDSQTQLRLSLAQQRLETGWKLLAATVGVPDLPIAPLAFSLETPPPGYEWQPVVATVLTRSSEVQEAQAFVRQAEILIRRAQAERCPNLLLGVRPFYTFPDQVAQLDVQIGMNIPVFNRNQGNIYSAQADLVLARENGRLVELRLQERLATAFQRYAAAKKQVDAYNSGILRDAEESLRLVRIGYQGGDPKYNYAVVLQAQRTVAQAELARAQASGELWKAAAEIAGLMQE